jgi:hypothetical protein
MLFVLLFAAGILIVPVLLDAKQHGGVTIFRRAGRELMEHERVRAGLERVRSGLGVVSIQTERFSNAIVGIVGVVVTIFVVIVGIYIGLTVIRWLLWLIQWALR